MGNYGIKVAQPGYDVTAAADNELLFSSSWPLLKIIHEGDYIISSDVTQTIWAHNLNHPSAFFVCDYSSGQSTSNPSLNNFITNNSSQLIYQSSAGQLTSFPYKIHYYIYDLDLTTSFTGPIVKQSFETPGFRTTNYGIKVSKPGKDVSSQDYRDFAIHSGTQSPIIHMVANTIGPSSLIANSKSVLATHNLGYLPLFFPFVSDGNGNYRFTGNFNQSTPRVFGNLNATELILGNSTNPSTLVIFKDPYSIDIPNLVVNA